MAKRHRSAMKQARQDEKRRLLNRRTLLSMKAAIKEASKSKTPDALSKAYSMIDKSAKKGIIHRNTAARKKSRLAKLVAKKEEPTAVTKKAEKPKSKKGA